MQTRAIEHYEATFESSPHCVFVQKANQRLVVHIPVLLVVELRTILFEWRVSGHIIEWILYSPGTRGTENLSA